MHFKKMTMTRSLFLADAMYGVPTNTLCRVGTRYSVSVQKPRISLLICIDVPLSDISAVVVHSG
jgi:hypothetical protein